MIPHIKAVGDLSVAGFDDPVILDLGFPGSPCTSNLMQIWHGCLLD